MQAVHDASREDPNAPSSPGAEGLCPYSDEVAVQKPGWRQPVGVGRLIELGGRTLGEPWEDDRLSYDYLVFERFRLSHAAALYLLQGASLRTLLTDVSVVLEVSPLALYSLAFAESEPLWKPPPMLPRLVLAHLTNLPKGMKADEVFRVLLEEELRRRG